jgi:hypothetical protein
MIGLHYELLLRLELKTLSEQLVTFRYGVFFDRHPDYVHR